MKKITFLTSLILFSLVFGGSNIASNSTGHNVVYAISDSENNDSEIDSIPAYEEGKNLFDGEYFLTTNPDSRGNTTFLKMKVENGEVVEFEYDAFMEDGSNKSENEEYNLAMKEDGGTSYAEGKEEIEIIILESQEPEVDTVSGATTSARIVNNMVKVIFAMAQNNITQEVNYDEVFYEGLMLEFIDTDCAC